MKLKIVYDMYSDPSHGWLKVKRSELERLKILEKISHCSYQKDEYVYLEEDCDLSTFFHAKLSIDNIRIKLCDHYSNKQSKIRSYNSFKV